MGLSIGVGAYGGEKRYSSESESDKDDPAEGDVAADANDRSSASASRASSDAVRRDISGCGGGSIAEACAASMNDDEKSSVGSTSSCCALATAVAGSATPRPSSGASASIASASSRRGEQCFACHVHFRHCYLVAHTRRYPQLRLDHPILSQSRVLIISPSFKHCPIVT